MLLASALPELVRQESPLSSRTINFQGTHWEEANKHLTTSHITLTCLSIVFDRIIIINWPNQTYRRPSHLLSVHITIRDHGGQVSFDRRHRLWYASFIPY